jgi:hypothetical protein
VAAAAAHSSAVNSPSKKGLLSRDGAKGLWVPRVVSGKVEGGVVSSSVGTAKSPILRRLGAPGGLALCMWFSGVVSVPYDSIMATAGQENRTNERT